MVIGGSGLVQCGKIIGSAFMGMRHRQTSFSPTGCGLEALILSAVTTVIAFLTWAGSRENCNTHSCSIREIGAALSRTSDTFSGSTLVTFPIGRRPSRTSVPAFRFTWRRRYSGLRATRGSQTSTGRSSSRPPKTHSVRSNLIRSRSITSETKVGSAQRSDDGQLLEGTHSQDLRLDHTDGCGRRACRRN